MLHPRHAAGRVTAVACLVACRDLGRSDLSRHPSQDYQLDNSRHVEHPGAAGPLIIRGPISEFYINPDYRKLQARLVFRAGKT
jgi:hypothetical protein